MPEPGREARPISREALVYPGFYSIDQLSSQVHKSVAAIDNGFSRRVPESALAYYIAVTAYVRLLKVLDMPGRPITSEEDSFMRMIYAEKFECKQSLVVNVKSEEDDSIGWFGKINEHTHYLYAAYSSCLAVYTTRIVADMSFTIDEGLDPVWQLPPDIRPDDASAGNATSNLLGFKPANKLTPLQMQWLIESGFNDEAGYVNPPNHSIASRANDGGANRTLRD